MALFFIANCSLCSFLVHISGWVVRECVTQEHLSNLSCFSFLGHCIAVDENSGVNVLVRPSKKWLRDWESFSFWNACEPLHLIGLNFVGLPKLTNFWRSMSKILSGQKLCPAKLNFVYKYSDKTGENVGLSNILSVEKLCPSKFCPIRYSIILQFLAKFGWFPFWRSLAAFHDQKIIWMDLLNCGKEKS